MAESKIVVGVDGSANSLAALHVAVEEAALRGASLCIVMAWQLTWSEIAIESPAVVKQIVLHNEQILEHALVEIDHGRGAGVKVTTELVNGHPATELLAAAADASMLVVGSRGMSGLAGALLGSVTHAVVHHAPCPVLVVPPPRA